MSQQSIKNLQRLKGELFKKFGVLKIGYFESYIDYHHNKLCDVNILVELEEPLGWKFFDLKEFIELKLDIHIDICTMKALKPALKEDIIANTHFV